MVVSYPSQPRRSYHADVMVSSTTYDLPAYRKAVQDAIWQMRMYPLAMERDTAGPVDAVAYSLDMVDEAEVYIGIFAHRYGYVPAHPDNPEAVSITEMEYRRARERGIPILIFIMDDDHPPDPDSVEAGPGAEKLQELKDRLKRDHRVGFFTTPEDLSARVYQALSRLKEDGVIQDDAALYVYAVPPIPKLPDPYVPHPYILTQTFFGRREELRLLDEWAESEDATMVIEAIGGIGKSALTWEWFNRQDHHTFNGMIWWSFYESDSAISNFTRHALAYLTGKLLAAFDHMTQPEREQMLLQKLCEGRYLVVFDGLERIMVAYRRMDAPHILDDQVDVTLRDCIDPRTGTFLQRLTHCAGSKVLISSRLMPADLENRAGLLLVGVRRHQLSGLHPDDALELMRHLGIKGEPRTLRRFLAQFDHHSLLLSIIAGRIRDHRPAPGDFDAWYRAEGQYLRLSSLDLAQRRTHILQYALNGLDPVLRKLLGQIAVFRYRVDYQTLSVLNPFAPPEPSPVPPPNEEQLAQDRDRLAYEEKLREQDPQEYAKSAPLRRYLRDRIAEMEAALPERKAAYEMYQRALAEYRASNAYQRAQAKFYAGLRELEDRGLLQWDRTTNYYDLHPVVRAYAFEGLAGDERKAVFERIRDHFTSLPPTPLEDVRDLSDLHRDLEIYHALVGEGLLDSAAEFYAGRLARVLHHNIAAYHTMVELLTPLFPQGIDQLPAVSSAEHQSACLNHLASAYGYLGQNERALVLKGLKIQLNLDRRDSANLGVGLRNYAISLRADGRIAAARRAIELALELASADGDLDGRAFSHLSMLAITVTTGHWDEAETYYEAFCEDPPRLQTVVWQAEAERYRAAALVYQGQDSMDALNEAWALAVHSHDALGMRHLHRLRGEIAMWRGSPDAAAEHFQDAIALARQHGGADLAIYLGCLARVRAAQRAYGPARALIAESFDQPYLTQLHDIHNNAAEVWLALDEPEQAARHALDAYRLAWADGPPFAWWWSLERAARTLTSLGLEPPRLRPFDEDAVAPVPYEDRIRAWITALWARRRR